MSIICPTPQGSAVQNCDNDIAINFLKDIFGDEFIQSFYVPNTPHPTLVSPSTDTIMALIASNLAHAALIVAFIVIIFTIYKGIISSANDGAAVGLGEKSSIIGMIGRPIFSLAMLAPTVSGFPVIYILVVMITLLANGFANQGLRAYIGADIAPSAITARLNDPNYQVANDMVKPMFYGALHGFCTKYAAQTFDSNMYLVRSSVYYDTTGSAYSTLGALGSNKLARTTFKMEYKDKPPGLLGSIGQFFGMGKSGISGDVCGSFASDFDTPKMLPGNSDPIINLTNGVTNNISGKAAKIAALRLDYAQRAYFIGYAHANGDLPRADPNNVGGETAQSFCAGNRCPVPPGSGSGWSTNLDDYGAESENGSTPTPVNPNDRPDVEKIIALSNTMSKALDYQIQDILAQDPIDNSMTQILNATVSQGWMAAGTFRTRIQKFRNALQNALYSTPYTVTFANIQGDGNEGELDKFVGNMMAFKGTLFQRVSESPNLPAYSNFKVESAIASFDTSNKDIEGLTVNVANHATNAILSVEQRAIEMAMGVGDNDGIDSLTRMQMLGEIISSMGLMLGSIHKAFLLGVAVAGVATAFGAGFTKYVVDASAVINSIRDYYMDTLGGWVFEASEALFEIGRIFAVIIPTMPYVFLTLAAVGWFMQIIQTAFGMPLFFIMHAIPEKSFVGSQAQGYVTLVSLFFRPIIILAAFFLSFVLYDPVITYASQMYFSIHSEVAASSFESGIMRFFIVMSTFKFYWYVYASMIMLLTYLVFGLVQELADSVLNWIGTNLITGFGNLETGGAMKTATAGMKAAGNSVTARKQAMSQEKQANAATKGAEGGGQAASGQAAGGQAAGGRQSPSSSSSPANQPASMGASNRSSLGGTGPAPGDSLVRGSLGVAAAVGAGHAVAGAARGAVAGASNSFQTSRNAGAGVGMSAAKAGGAALVGLGAGAGRGFGRGVRTINGINSYKNNLKAKEAAGGAGSKGDRGNNKVAAKNVAAMNKSGMAARPNMGAPFSAQGLGAVAGLQGKMVFGQSLSPNARFSPIAKAAPKQQASAYAQKNSFGKGTASIASFGGSPNYRASGGA